MSTIRENNASILKGGKKLELCNLPLMTFLAFAAIILATTYMGMLPSGLLGVLPFLMVLGGIMSLIGDNTPILKDYLGGGAMLAIFGCSALSHFGLVPDAVIENTSTFLRSGQFMNFFLVALITGSLLGMDRKLLVKSFLKYIPTVIGGVIVSILLTGLIGAIIGYGAKEAILFITVPIMGGGVGAGAIPLSEIYGAQAGTDPGSYLGIMIPALTLGNAVAIIVSGLLDRLGKKKTELSGNGALMKIADNEVVEQKTMEFPALTIVGTGALISCAFYMAASIIGKVVPIHPFAIMIILVSIIKFSGVLPEKLEIICFGWYKFFAGSFTLAMLCGAGLVFVKFSEIISALTPQYILLVIITVIGSVIGAGLAGKLMGFYPIEAAITGGLCMANTGGTGDIAVLQAADRMVLMPFAQISSRLGGAFMIILATALVRMFL